MTEKSKRRCSFCGRTENEAGMLISGMSGYICTACVEQAHEILREENLLAKSDFELKELPKPKEIKAFLDNYVIGQYSYILEQVLWIWIIYHLCFLK